MSFISSILAQYWKSADPITFAPLGVFMDFYRATVPNWPSILFYCFVVGAIVYIAKMVLEYDQHSIYNEADRFNLVLILCTLSLFIFGLRAQTYELRWFFAFLPAMLAFTSKGMIWIAEMIGRHKKVIVNLLIVLMLGLGIFMQLTYADALIKNKVLSYGPVKDAGIWMKENSVKGDSIISMSTPQVAYYSERETYNFQTNVVELEKLISEKHPKFVMFSAFEYHNDGIKQWLIDSESRLTMAHVIFSDPQKTQPIVIVYLIKYS